MEKLMRNKWGLFYSYKYVVSCKEEPFIITAKDSTDVLQLCRYFEQKHPGCHRRVKRYPSIDGVDEQMRKERLTESMDEKSGEGIACLVLK